MKSFSVIIATYNRCADLKGCLESLLNQKVSGDCSFDVIVVDNNSSDHTPAIVKFYAEKFPQRVQYLFEPVQGKSLALNRAIKSTKSDILIFTDDDVTFDRDWFQNICQCVKAYDFDAAGGRILPQYPDGTPSWIKKNTDILSGPIVAYDYGPDIKVYDPQTMNPLVGANLIVKRDLFERDGFFNIILGPGTGSFGDDTEICHRWEHACRKLYYFGNILVWHPVQKDRMNLRYIARWKISAGRYYVREQGRQLLAENPHQWWGVPRYLFRQLGMSVVGMAREIFNTRKFLKAWEYFFVSLGMIQEFRRCRL